MVNGTPLLSGEFEVESAYFEYTYYNTSTTTDTTTSVSFTSTNFLFTSASFKPVVEKDEKQIQGSIDACVYTITKRALEGSFTLVMTNQALSYTTTSGARFALADLVSSMFTNPTDFKITFKQKLVGTVDNEDDKNLKVIVDPGTYATYFDNSWIELDGWDIKTNNIIELSFKFSVPYECFDIDTETVI